MVAYPARLPELPSPDHASDALAVALCHINASPLADALARRQPWGRDDRARSRRGDDTPLRPRGGAVWWRRLPRGGLGRDTPPRPRGGRGTRPCTRIWWCATTPCSLHGFHCEQERELFLMLISVQAIGPRSPWRRSQAARRASCSPPSPPPTAPFSSCAGDRQAHRRAHHRRVAREGRADDIGLRRAGAPWSPGSSPARACPRGAAGARLQRAREPIRCCATSRAKPPRS